MDERPRERVSASLVVSIPSLFTCTGGGGGDCLKITTPLLCPDGDYIDLYAVETSNGLYLTDLGETMGYLDTVSKQRLERCKNVKGMLLAHEDGGVELSQGELRVSSVDRDEIVWKMTRLLQVIVQLLAILALPC